MHLIPKGDIGGIINAFRLRLLFPLSEPSGPLTAILSGCSPLEMPSILGIEGPYKSASRIPTYEERQRENNRLCVSELED